MIRSSNPAKWSLVVCTIPCWFANQRSVVSWPVHRGDVDILGRCPTLLACLVKGLRGGEGEKVWERVSGSE